VHADRLYFLDETWFGAFEHVEHSRRASGGAQSRHMTESCIPQATD
jgi:hypothetical protein